jgi:CSLREA domain-containing protein
MLKRRFVILLLLTLVVVVMPTPVLAATINVTTAADPINGPINGDGCTLREAIQNANDNDDTYTDCAAGSGADTITFSGGISQITLSDTNQTGDLSVNENLTISQAITLDGGGKNRIFVIGGGATLTLQNVTLQNGHTSGGGGAVLINNGNLTLVNSNLKNNHADFDGGAINGSGALTITNTIFDTNTAGRDGGAIWEVGVGAVTITTSRFVDNEAGGSGGALFAGNGQDNDPEVILNTITATSFDGNIAKGAEDTDGGGAIHLWQNTEYLITASVFVSNQATGSDGRGGAIYNSYSNELWVNYSHFGTPPSPLPPPFNTLTTLPNEVKGANGVGGAIYNRDTMRIIGSSFFSNKSAGGGGALATNAPEGENALIANSTFSNNEATGNGGGILQFGASVYREISLYNVTVASNTAANGGGIYNDSQSGSVVAYNTIIANNTGGNCGGANFDNQGGNVVFGGSCPANTTMPSGNPQLESPQPYFSIPNIVTYVRPIGADSAAGGAGVASTCQNFPVLNIDQRGFPRPQGYANCDAGAYEGAGTPPEIAVAHNGSAINDGSSVSLGTTSEGTPITWTIDVSNQGDATLTLGALSAAPDGFSLTNFESSEVPANSSTSFNVTCDATTPGTYSGSISFTNNDPNESPFDFTVSCVVNATPTFTPSATLEGGTPHPTATDTPTETLAPPTETPTSTITPGGPTLTPTDTITPGGPTLTPTNTLDVTELELVSNGGFEAKDASSGKPNLLPWVAKGATQDKIKCNKPDKIVARSGDCAYQFKGSVGENSKIQQNAFTVGLPFAVGDLLDLSVYVNAGSSAAKGKIKVRVKYSDGTDTGKITEAIITTTEYTEIPGGYVLVSGAVSKIKVGIQNSSTSGKVYIDDVSLLYTAGGGLRNLIPLP